MENCKQIYIHLKVLKINDQNLKNLLIKEIINALKTNKLKPKAKDKKENVNKKTSKKEMIVNGRELTTIKAVSEVIKVSKMVKVTMTSVNALLMVWHLILNAGFAQSLCNSL